MRQFGRWLLFTVVALFLAAPIIVVAGVSVNAKKTLQFPPAGFSLGGTGRSSPIRVGEARS